MGPAVSVVAVTPDAGDDNTYGLGDEIRVRLTFSEGVSTYQIALRLNDLDIPTKGGCKWHPLGVRRILQNRVYTGRSSTEKTGTRW